MKTIQNYINGKLQAPKNNHYLEAYNPAEGVVYVQVPDSQKRDVEEAIVAAKNAFPDWSAISEEERYVYLDKIPKAIEDNLEALAEAESIDNGKPLWLSKSVDIPRFASNFRFFATAAMQYW